MANKYDLFLSYSRSDDELFVKRLYDDLIKTGFSIWWDRVDMPSRSLTFLQEIRDAIEACDRLIAIIGPNAVSSDYVRAEWEHAFIFCKAVIPVLRIGDYKLVPNNISTMNMLHCPDLRDSRHYETSFKELLDKLAEPVPPLGQLLNEIPSLPPHFLPRPEDMARLAARVLADVQRPTVITSASQTTALIGMGGIGKSVLAAVFARSSETRRSCTDGIVWVPIGRQPDLQQKIRLVGAAFDDNICNYADETLARAQLGKVLADKVCLLVLDDVWEVKHTEPFRNALGSRCRLLVTTRNGNLATALEAKEHRLGVLDDSQAAKLLAEWADQDVRSLPCEAQEVAKECGNLPLALAMVGAMVKGALGRWGTVLHRLLSADLGKIKQQFPNYPYPDLLLAIQVSVDALDMRERKCYLDLSVFPDGIPIPEATLQTFWAPEGLDTYDTQDVINRFVSLSLAWRDQLGRLTMHDLQRDYVCKQLPDIRSLHVRLLKAYGLQCLDGWSSGPNDGYFFDNLTNHLVATDSYLDLRELFADQRWMNARVGNNGYQYFGYLADLAKAWEIADSKVAEDETYFLDSFLYGLIQTSINSLASNYTPGMIAVAVESGLWSPERALGVAERMSDKEQACDLLTLLLGMDKLNDSQRMSTENKALNMAFAVYHNHRGRRLAALIPHIKGEQYASALQGVLDAVLGENGGRRSETLKYVVPLMDAEQNAPFLQQFLEAAYAIENIMWRADALAAVIPKLSGDQQTEVIRQTLDAIIAIDSDGHQALALAYLAGQLTSEKDASFLHEALDMALAIADLRWQACALIPFIPSFTGKQRSYIETKAHAAAHGIQNLYDRAEALAAVAHYIHGEQQMNALQEAVEATFSIKQPWLRAQILAAVAPLLKGAQNEAILQRAFTAAVAIDDENHRAMAFIALAPQVTGEQRGANLQMSFDAALATGNESLLVGMTPYLSGAETVVALRYALDSVLIIKDERSQVEGLIALARNLRGVQKAKVLRHALDVVAIAIKGEDTRVEILVALAPLLEGEEQVVAVQTAFNAALAIEDPTRTAQALAKVAPHLTGARNASKLLEALNAVLSIEGEVRSKPEGSLMGWVSRLWSWNEFSRVQALAAFVPHISGELHETLLRKLLITILEMDDESDQAMALTYLAPLLGAEQNSLKPSSRLKVLFGLPFRCTGNSQHASMLQQALEVALGINDDSDRAKALSALVPQLSGEQQVFVLRKGLDAALASRLECSLAIALSDVAPKISDLHNAAMLQEVINATVSIQDEEWRVVGLMGIIPFVGVGQSTPIFQQIYSSIMGIESQEWRAGALASMVPHLHGDQQQEILRQALDAIVTLENEESRVKVLSQIIIYLDKEKAIQHALECLHWLQNCNRDEFIRNCLELISNLSLKPKTHESLANGLIDICSNWRWL